MFVVLGALGTYVGSHINQRLNPQTLRRAFATFLIAMAAFILVREGSQLAQASAAGDNQARLQETRP